MVRRPSQPIGPGFRVGRWTIIRQASPSHDGGQVRTRYWARCQCGTEKALWRSDILRGRAKGCQACRTRIVIEPWLRPFVIRAWGSCPSDPPHDARWSDADSEAWTQVLMSWASVDNPLSIRRSRK